MSDDVTGSILEMLAHPLRRALISILASESRSGAVSYTELLTELQISTGRLNYHLRQMNGYLEKTKDYRYTLTPLGKKAHEVLEIVTNSAVSEPDITRYLKPTVRKSTFVTLVKSMTCILIVGVTVPVFFISMSLFNELVAPSDWTYIVFNIIALGLGISVLVWLIVALKHAPDFARKLEERLYA